MLHVFNTWLVANLLHPLFIYFMMGSMDGEWFDGNFFPFAFFGICYSLIFSIPLLIIAWLMFFCLKKIPLSVQVKFGAWLFLATIIPLLFLLSVSLITRSNELKQEDIELILPASLSVLVTVLIRYKQFFNLLEQAIIKQDNNDQN